MPTVGVLAEGMLVALVGPFHTLVDVVAGDSPITTEPGTTRASVAVHQVDAFGVVVTVVRTEGALVHRPFPGPFVAILVAILVRVPVRVSIRVPVRVLIFIGHGSLATQAVADVSIPAFALIRAVRATRLARRVCITGDSTASAVPAVTAQVRLAVVLVVAVTVRRAFLAFGHALSLAAAHHTARVAARTTAGSTVVVVLQQVATAGVVVADEPLAEMNDLGANPVFGHLGGNQQIVAAPLLSPVQAGLVGVAGERDFHPHRCIKREACGLEAIDRRVVLVALRWRLIRANHPDLDRLAERPRGHGQGRPLHLQGSALRPYPTTVDRNRRHLDAARKRCQQPNPTWNTPTHSRPPNRQTGVCHQDASAYRGAPHDLRNGVMVRQLDRVIKII